MRNWNLTVLLRVVHLSLLLIEPLRNWNEIQDIQILNQVHAFNRTFEELKYLSVLTTFTIFPLLIEPLRNWNSLSAPERRLSPTLLIEPLRNWNLAILLMVGWDCVLLIEPLRNWNMEPHIRQVWDWFF